MANQYYNRVAAFFSRTIAKGGDVRSELDAVSAAFDLLPKPRDDGEGFEAPVAIGNATEAYHAVSKEQLDNTIAGNNQNKLDSVAAQGASENARDVSVSAKERAQLHAGYSELWAIAAENTPISVEAGGDGSTKFSALHWSIKASYQVDHAKKWATNAEDTPLAIEAGGDGSTTFSAMHWALKAKSNSATQIEYAAEWANKGEDHLISSGGGGDEVSDFSAKHWAYKSAKSAAQAALFDPSSYYTKAEIDNQPASTGLLLEIVVLTSGTTYTLPDGVSFAIVTLQSGGKGGSRGSNYLSFGRSGTCGHYSKFKANLKNVETITYSIGAGGPPATSAGGTGSDGGTTSITIEGVTVNAGYSNGLNISSPNPSPGDGGNGSRGVPETPSVLGAIGKGGAGGPESYALAGGAGAIILELYS